jgi:hypothetical protein
MTGTTDTQRRRVLDPIERIAEVLFGLIMALTFTGSLGAATAGRDEVRTMLIGAIGCNIAWGLVDAVMYLVNTIVERRRGRRALQRVRNAATPDEGCRILADELSADLAAVLNPAELEDVRRRLVERPEPAAPPRLGRGDFAGALGVFLLVSLATFPVVIPFLFLHDAMPAKRISNGIAVLLLFWSGYSLGRHAGYRPWRMGLSMVAIGVILVAITIALGG